MYTRCQLQQSCLHSSNCLFALQQNSAKLASQTAKRPPETGGLSHLVSLKRRGLFGRLLPRRIERAGIVDFGDLVVGEAEHLAQDLVGVLAEQRRSASPRSVLSDSLIGLPTEMYLPRVG